MMRSLWRATRLAFLALLLGTVLHVVVASAAEPGFVPLIDFLPDVPVLFGVSGGLLVTVLVSVLKHFKIVGKDGPIPSRVANFALSLLVAATAMVVEGQPVGSALITAFSSIIVAAGAHSEVGHPLYSAAEWITKRS